jgi:hypothetical protein
MNRREELQRQYVEYERKLDELKEAGPENEVLSLKHIKVVYLVEHDELSFEESDHFIGLSGDEAEKLYHFLGGLYERH